MNKQYINPSVRFARSADDNLIHPICRSPIQEGDTVCYEIPAKSTAQSFKLDIFRYTMQCVYSGESLFPCAFNQEPPDDEVRMFFDCVFCTTHRRDLSEKLALALYDKNKNNAPFLYKAIGIFDSNDKSNCVRVSYENGEVFIAASRDVQIGEVLSVSPLGITAPMIEGDNDFSTTLRLMSAIEIRTIPIFTKALSYRKNAEIVRPKGNVEIVNSKLDPGLEDRVAKYTIDRELGITDFRSNLDRLEKKHQHKERGEDLRDLEEMFTKLNDKFEDEVNCNKNM